MIAPKRKMPFTVTMATVCLAFSLSCCQSISPVQPPVMETCADSTGEFSHTIEMSWSIGQLGSLQDVYIASANNIWAVGSFYLPDGSGDLDPILYNLQRWDGVKWNSQRIVFPDCSAGRIISSGPAEIRAVYGFGPDDIWFTEGGSVVHWNGHGYTMDCSPSTIIKGSLIRLWGFSSQDLFAVGGNGTIIHFDGKNWSLIPTGTTLPIRDLHGAINTTTGKKEVLCVAALAGTGRAILKVAEDFSVTILPDSGLPTDLTGIWFWPGGKCYVVGGGIFEKQNLDTISSWKKVDANLISYCTSINGRCPSDIIISAGQFYLDHFNGRNWHLDGGCCGGVTMGRITDSFVVQVGGEGGNPAISVFKR